MCNDSFSLSASSAREQPASSAMAHTFIKIDIKSLNVNEAPGFDLFLKNEKGMHVLCLNGAHVFSEKLKDSITRYGRNVLYTKGSQ